MSKKAIAIPGRVCRKCGKEDVLFYVHDHMCALCRREVNRQYLRKAFMKRDVINNSFHEDYPPKDLACQCCSRSKEAIINWPHRFTPKFPGMKIPAKLSRHGEYPGIYKTDKVLAIKFRCLQAHGEVYTDWECKHCWHKDDAYWAKKVIARGIHVAPEPYDDVPVHVPPDWAPPSGTMKMGDEPQKWEWLEWYLQGYNAMSK